MTHTPDTMKALAEREQVRVELISLLSYDAETGVLTWKQRLNPNALAGGTAGCVKQDGYRYVKFKGKEFLAHRLCWAMHYGEVPPIGLDHQNCDKADNRIANLRLATVAENNRNRGKLSNNKSGFKGVSLHKATGKFAAQITADKTDFHLGFFDTAEEASEAYKKAAEEKHNDFARG